MNDGITQPLLASFLISTLSFLGSFSLFSGPFKQNKISYFVSFAAGVMLSAALLDIIPEALEMGDPHELLMYVLGGIILSFLMERFALFHHHHHDDTHHIKPSAYLVLVGDAFHNFIDGVAIATTFLVNPAVGVATTIAIAAHEIPQELADFSILVNSGLEKKKALLYNFLSALTALVGVIVGYYFIQQFEGITGPLLGFTGGIFLYISLADLIPELHNDHRQQKSWHLAFIFLLGIAVLYFLIGFTHE